MGAEEGKKEGRNEAEAAVLLSLSPSSPGGLPPSLCPGMERGVTSQGVIKMMGRRRRKKKEKGGYAAAPCTCYVGRYVRTVGTAWRGGEGEISHMS